MSQNFSSIDYDWYLDNFWFSPKITYTAVDIFDVNSLDFFVANKSGPNQLELSIASIRSWIRPFNDSQLDKFRAILGKIPMRY